MQILRMIIFDCALRIDFQSRLEEDLTNKDFSTIDIP